MIFSEHLRDCITSSTRLHLKLERASTKSRRKLFLVGVFIVTAWASFQVFYGGNTLIDQQSSTSLWQSQVDELKNLR